MANKDPYKILEVEKNSSEDEVKKSYRRLSKLYHPDVKETGDESRFKEIAEAYEILSDPNKKAKYDRGEMNENFGGQRQGNSSMEDFFRNFHFGGEPGFNFFGGRGQRQSQTQRGSDLRIKIPLTIHEIITGVHKKIIINRNINCKTCSGTGAKNKESIINCSRCDGAGFVMHRQQTPMGVIAHQSTCPACGGQGKEIIEKCNDCHGNGLMSHSDNIEFDIPAGAVDGINLSVNGLGSEAKGGGIAGNLIVEVSEIEHQILKRDNSNIISDIFISYYDAVIGNDSLEIETVDGLVKVKIDPGTESGKILRLRAKGIPNINNPSQRGDQLVFINIFVPKNLSEEEQKVVSKLKKIKTSIPDSENTQNIKGVYSRIRDYEELY